MKDVENPVGGDLELVSGNEQRERLGLGVEMLGEVCVQGLEHAAKVRGRELFGDQQTRALVADTLPVVVSGSPRR